MYQGMRKLALNRETLRNLQDSDLTRVVGGKRPRCRPHHDERDEYFEVCTGGSRTCQPDIVIAGDRMNAGTNGQPEWGP